MDLTPDQLNQLQQLGIDPFKNYQSNQSKDINKHQNISNNTLSLANNENQPIISSQKGRLLNTHLVYIPLLSISGLTLVSLGGLILFKTKTTTPISSPQPLQEAFSSGRQSAIPSPTQVPKSIQHYLLASQQFFTQALQSQTQSPSPDTLVALLNQSITSATDAITAFPNDYRGYQQRGRIYLSLIDSKPDLLSAAVSDLSHALSLNPNSAELAHDLASLYARQGDANKTLAYLSQAVAIDPTKAQNFYDLAKLQQQAGLIPQAINTYSQLLTLVSDPSQKSQVETEKKALENLYAQSNPSHPNTHQPTPTISFQSPLIQAALPPQLLEGLDVPRSAKGYIIAAPETAKSVTVSNQTDANALSGTATLPSGQSSIAIPNHNLKSTSQVYLTITKGGKNQNLQVLSKTTDSFTAGFDTPLSEDIEFKWWIIN